MSTIVSSKATEQDWRYPLIDPNRTGLLRLQDTPPHTLYWEEYGNPNGEPVLVVHGGPGGASAPFMVRYFDPQRYRIILYDQRGCGKSTPHACLEDNSTWHLVFVLPNLSHLSLVLINARLPTWNCCATTWE